MSYALMAYAVDLDRVVQAIGSADQVLLEAVLARFGDDFDELDEMAADCADEDAGEVAPGMRDVLTQMVAASAYHENFGFLYGYALKFLCEHFGSCLPNNETGDAELLESTDELLEDDGLPGSAPKLTELIYRGSPIAIPAIDDFPMIGYLKRAEIVAAAKAYQYVHLDDWEDDEAAAAVAQIQGWFETCLRQRCDLVCFYH